MSDNNNKPKINVPRFNLTWLYVIIALIFAFLYFPEMKEAPPKR